MEYIVSIYDSFVSIIKTFGFTDIIDIAAVSILIYAFIRFIRETRAAKLVKGILILVVTYIVSYQLNLTVLTALLNYIFQFSVFALLVVFQPELRRALEQIGRGNFGDYWSIGSYKSNKDFLQVQKELINIVSDAAETFQKNKVGALIVFERSTKLGDIINTGTTINALPSTSIIGNIFFNKAPLHDGAMIIRDSMIYAAGCILPLTKNENVNINLGTRHRAAMGMSENSDAVIVVVSEETGSISLAINGVLKMNYNKNTLIDELTTLLIPEHLIHSEKKTARDYIRKVTKR